MSWLALVRAKDEPLVAALMEGTRQTDALPRKSSHSSLLAAKENASPLVLLELTSFASMCWAGV